MGGKRGKETVKKKRGKRNTTSLLGGGGNFLVPSNPEGKRVVDLLWK